VRPVQRAVLIAAAVAAVLASGARAAVQASCRPTAEIRQHDEAVFGHFATRAGAQQLMRRAAKLGFRGLKIEDEGCGDFELEIDGADRVADRVSFAAEAKKAGFQVTFEQTGPPLQPPKGQAVGTFAKLATVTAANALAQRLAASGFRYIDIVKVGARWAVVMPQVPVKHALSIAAEVHKAGFRITFVTG
jgi:hypothetical protein